MTPQEALTRLEALLREAQSLLGPLQATVVPAPTTPVPQPTPAPDTRLLAFGAKVSKTFRERVWWIADELTKRQGALFDANWLMACMAFETGERFTANVRSPVSSATGLIQFMSQTAASLGTTTAHLASLSAEDQLNYVFKYFDQQIKVHGPIRSLEDCYMAILWPAAIGKPTEYPLFVNEIAKLRDTYDVNKGLDANKDNTVTKAEAAARVTAELVKGLQPGYAA